MTELHFHIKCGLADGKLVLAFNLGACRWALLDAAKPTINCGTTLLRPGDHLWFSVLASANIQARLQRDVVVAWDAAVVRQDADFAAASATRRSRVLWACS